MNARAFEMYYLTTQIYVRYQLKSCMSRKMAGANFHAFHDAFTKIFKKKMPLYLSERKSCQTCFSVKMY